MMENTAEDDNYRRESSDKEEMHNTGNIEDKDYTQEKDYGNSEKEGSGIEKAVEIPENKDIEYTDSSEENTPRYDPERNSLLEQSGAKEGDDKLVNVELDLDLSEDSDVDLEQEQKDITIDIINELEETKIEIDEKPLDTAVTIETTPEDAPESKTSDPEDHSYHQQSHADEDNHDTAVVVDETSLTDNKQQMEANMEEINLEETDKPSESQQSSGQGLAFNLNERSADRVVDTTDLWATDVHRAVRLKVAEKGPSAFRPISVPSMMKSTVEKVPHSTALAVKRKGQWVRWTYKQYYEDVVRTAKAFIKLGLMQGYGVGILGFNSPEWLLSDMGAIYAGGLATGIYTTNSPEACHYVAEMARCNILVVENDVQLQKILKVRDRLPDLKAIVQYIGDLKERYEDVYTWSEMMALAENVPDSAVQERLDNMAVNKCCVLIFTSGTTGNPKGVMFSHDNVSWTCQMATISMKFSFGREVTISYLPLSHIAAQLSDIYAMISVGGTVFFAQPDALKGSLVQTLQEVRPTAFLGVPRVWEKIQENIQNKARDGGNLKKKMGAWAKGVGLKGNKNLLKGGTTPAGWGLANAIVFKKVRKLLGFDRCKLFYSAAAPLMKETSEYFMSLNINIHEIYGMSESTGPHTMTLPWDNRFGSVGKVIPGVVTKLDKPDADGNGEICMGGRHVFMGYIGMDDKTAETIDESGYLHTGDVGREDEDGFLYITGRIKELIITAGGENIPPVLIEEIVKQELPIVSQCMLIGDKKKFLSMLITLKSEVNNDTMLPRDRLSPLAIDWCHKVGSNSNSVTKILDSKDENVLRSIQQGIERVNRQAVSRAQMIQKWSVLPQDFSIPGGELGPTMKVKRPVVMNKYARTVEAFYANT